jgi:hypothetical protein
MSEAVVTLAPTLGQVVVFTCTDESFNGIPDPIQCPEGTFRRSLAFYYFTTDGTTPDPRSTMWKERGPERTSSAVRAPDSANRPRMRDRPLPHCSESRPRTLRGSSA